ncbi:cyclic nucleotide-binding domain-containing protein [Oscillatoria sp. FACHB-1407]|uniref:cyclic nucleotide-binding domain-containing protein n=1 Tax=Oscillatoria sp. FACHB-1407 TaxID=2692847 RepID=UPI00168721C7|nr:cyclic nucleotide-binding domain-containing protein [Oscillatoria sp. FACHB-1407]MBD2463072.1 cyclic nucleotide-binding domain-containing protein [Oscillatoria sp. FACHB-1407]
MAEVLLKELSNADLNWLMATGQRQELLAGTVLLQAEAESDALYILLAGSLSICIDLPEPGATDHLTASPDQTQEIIRLTQGDIVGETLLFQLRPLAATVKVAEDAIVLTVSQSQLVEKLHEDSCFSTHLHRAIALIVAERLRRMLEMPHQFRGSSNQPVKEAIVVFGEMRDSDVDWLISVGHLEKLLPNQVLIQPGRPLDALYIILDGLLSLAVSEGEFNPLTYCFQCAQANASSEKVIDYLSRGEMSGTISFLDFRPTPITVKAVKESLVLSIPRQQLTLKLQQDWRFASRFYRVMAIQLAETWQTVVERLNGSQQFYSSHHDIDASAEYDDELNFDSLYQVAQGAARFNWMLKRLGVV